MVAYASAFAALVGLTLIRQPGVSSLQTLWSEDGSIFVADAVHHWFSVGRRLVDPYAGYMHLVPRLLAELASHLPLAWAPLVMSGGAAAIVALLALFVYRSSATHIPVLPLRAALAGALVLLPIANVEALANAANLHWFLIFAAFWAFVWVPQRPAGRIVAAGVVVMATLSDPLTLLLAPLAIARVLAVRTWRDHLVTIAFVGAALIQVGVVWVAPYLGAGSREFHGADAYSLTQMFGTYIVAVNIAGVPLTAQYWGAIWAVAPWLGVAGFVAFALYILRRPPSLVRSLALVTLALSIGYFVVPLWISGTFEIGPIWTVDRTRYFVIPALMLLSSLFLVVSDHARRAHGSRRPIVMVVIVWYAAVTAMSLTYANARTDGPAWASALAQARQECLTSAWIEVPIDLRDTIYSYVKLNCHDIGE